MLDFSNGANRLSSGGAVKPFRRAAVQFNNMGAANGQTLAGATLTGGNNQLVLGTGYTAGMLVNLGTLTAGGGVVDISGLGSAPTWIQASGNPMPPFR